MVNNISNNYLKKKYISKYIIFFKDPNCFIYEYSTGYTSTWTNAESSCEAKGGRLATVTNQHNFDYLKEISAFEHLNFWVKFFLFVISYQIYFCSTSFFFLF